MVVRAIPGYTCRRVPTGYQTGSNSVLRAAILFNYRHRLTKMITGDWANNLKMLDLEYKLKKITIYGCLAFGWRFCNWQQSATCWWLLVVMLDWAGSQRRLSPTTRVGIKKPTQKNPPKKTQKNPPKKTH